MTDEIVHKDRNMTNDQRVMLMEEIMKLRLQLIDLANRFGMDRVDEDIKIRLTFACQEIACADVALATHIVPTERN